MASLQQAYEVSYHFERGAGAGLRVVTDPQKVKVLGASPNSTGILASVAAVVTTPPGYTLVIRAVQNVAQDVWC